MARRLSLLTGGAVSMVLAAGCGSGTPEASAGPTSVATTTSPSSTAVSTSTSATQTQPREPAACEAADLSVTRGTGGVGGGSAYYSLVFTNTSDETCTMIGFPTVSMVDGENGAEVGPPAGQCDDDNSTCGSAITATVTVEPGGAAHSRVQQANAGNLDPANCDPQPVEGLRVTPPDDTDSVFVAAEGTGCAAKGLLRVGAVAMGPGE